jgi:predicted DNA-binding transcriptional regulator YafY
MATKVKKVQPISALDPSRFAPLKSGSTVKRTATKTKAKAPIRKERATKISLERFNKIIRLLKKKGAVPMRELRSELSVSESSVKRDIEFLQSRFECPIKWDRSKRGWVLNDDGQFQLPGVWFEASEVFALLAMLHLVEGVQPGLLEDHIAPLKDRLRRMLAEGAKSAKRIDSKVKLIHFAPRKVEPKHFQVVTSALLDGKQLHLTYWNRDKQERTERVISPQQLVHYRENWFLDAWCHKNMGLRTFSLETIDAARILDAPSKEVSAEEMREHFQSGYGIFAGKATNRALLKFTPARAEYVSLETWHPDQTSSVLDDKSYLLEVPYSNDQELVMDLLRHGPEVEVLGPPALRAKVQLLLCAAAQKYDHSPPH